MDTKRRLEIEWECTRLAYFFAHCLDANKAEQIPALFTEDAVFDRIDRVLRGRDAIEAWAREFARNLPAGVVRRHICTNIHFTDVQETSAKAIVYVESRQGIKPEGEKIARFKPGQEVLIEISDTYKKVADGWRFAERLGRFVMLPEGFVLPVTR